MNRAILATTFVLLVGNSAANGDYPAEYFSPLTNTLVSESVQNFAKISVYWHPPTDVPVARVEIASITVAGQNSQFSTVAATQQSLVTYTTNPPTPGMTFQANYVVDSAVVTQGMNPVNAIFTFRALGYGVLTPQGYTEPVLGTYPIQFRLAP